jgi:hypothetical protein
MKVALDEVMSNGKDVVVDEALREGRVAVKAAGKREEERERGEAAMAADKGGRGKGMLRWRPH